MMSLDSFDATTMWTVWEFCFFSVFVGFIWGFFKNSYCYWKRRGVFYLQPTFPFGNFKDAVTKMSSGEAMKNLYDKARGHEFFGFWLFHRPAIMIRSPELAKQILVKDFSYFHDRAVYLNEESEALSGHLFALKGEEWKALRGKLTPTFTSGKMKAMFSLVLRSSEEMVNFMKPSAEAEEAVETREILARFTTDVISSCAFGIDTDSIKNPEAEFRKMGKKIFEPSFWSSLRISVLFMLPKLARALKLRIIPKDVSEFFVTAVKETMEEREKKSFARKDFMQLLIQLKNDGKIQDEEGTHRLLNFEKKLKMTVEKAAAQAFVFFLAGFETSSTTMTFSLYELSKNPQIQERLRKEIDETLKKFGSLNYEAVQEMKYLHKIVSETLRKYPPISCLNRECCKNYRIPGTSVEIEKGTLVVTSVLGLHRDPDHYSDPEKFDPERFSDPEKSKRNNFTYLPFGEGPRACIGLRFGLMQTKIGLTKLLATYEFSQCSKSPVLLEFDPNSIVMTPNGGMWLKISLRKDERLPNYNALVEVMLTKEIEDGDFDDIVEQILGYDDDFEDEEEEDETRCGPTASISAGYKDCMDEAIRFLVEEEKISPKHPVIRNLKAHLERSKDRILKSASLESHANENDGRPNRSLYHVENYSENYGLTFSGDSQCGYPFYNNIQNFLNTG